MDSLSNPLEALEQTPVLQWPSAKYVPNSAMTYAPAVCYEGQ